MKALLTLLVTCLGLAALAQNSNWNGQPGLPAINYVNIAQGNNSRITSSDQRIISTDSDWAKLYAMMAGMPKADPNQTPKVCDFNKQDLIVIHLGLKRTLGYRVYVSTISRPSASKKVVEVMVISPAQGSVNAQQMNSPFVVIAVDRTTGNYEFKYTNSTASTSTNLAGGCGCCGNCHCDGSCCGGGGGNGGVFIYKNGQLERHPNDQQGGGTYRYANGAMIPVNKGGDFLPPQQNGQQNGGQGNNQGGHGRDNNGGKGGGRNGD